MNAAPSSPPPTPLPVRAQTTWQVPSAILDLIQTAYPTAQGAVQQLLDAVYNALQFVETPADTAFWGDATGKYDNRRPRSELVAAVVASAIRDTAKAAMGGNGAPALLSFLDVEEVAVFVERVMEEREKVNKAEYLNAEMVAVLPREKLEKDWVKLRPFVRLGKFDPDNINSNRSYLDGLLPWERRYGHKGT